MSIRNKRHVAGFINEIIQINFLNRQSKHYHLLCFASVLVDPLLLGHQSLVHLLPIADIAEHTVSYTLALLGLCLQSTENVILKTTKYNNLKNPSFIT